MTKYREIQDYIKSKDGFTVKTCWIAHVKEMCGLPLRKAWNRTNPDSREVPCPNDKVEPIKSAFRHFGMIM